MNNRTIFCVSADEEGNFGIRFGATTDPGEIITGMWYLLDTLGVEPEHSGAMFHRMRNNVALKQRLWGMVLPEEVTS